MLVNKKDQLNSMYRGILDDLDPRVAHSVKQKYSQDRLEFIEAARECTPRVDLAYWASKKCKKCYGTGSRGVLRSYDGPCKKGVPAKSRIKIRCSCAEHNYMKWLAEFRLFYTSLKRQNDQDSKNKEGIVDEQSDSQAEK